MTVEIRIGDVFDRLAEIPDNSIDCVVTSPPYWGLRNYGFEGQIGCEPTWAEHVAVILRVMAEVHRVLKPEGTCWFNYGDLYATTPNGCSAADTKAAGNDDRTFRDKPFSTIQGSFKAKDLIMAPNRLAIALQDWGWWVRSEIIWHKPNPMPESIKDRPAVSHEKIFLLTKSARYFYDADAVRVASNWDKSNTKRPDGWDTGPGGHGSVHRAGREKGARVDLTSIEKKDKQRGHGRRHAGFNDRWKNREVPPRHKGYANHENLDSVERGSRNLRNVWTIATKPFSQAHFATFPPELPETCIKAGCPMGGMVLDPFGGSGTTGLVADSLARNCILIEGNPEYAQIAADRLRAGLVPTFGVDHPDASDLPLFITQEAS